MMIVEEKLDDYYSLLGLSYPSNSKEIKIAYKNLAKQFHPDRNIGNEEIAQQNFSRINFAYQVLGNETEKENYDFLYHKYMLQEPYLNPESACSTSCGCGPTVEISNLGSSKKRITLYVLGLLLILAMSLRYVINSFDAF